jgi:short-subunit dehydrogenase
MGRELVFELLKEGASVAAVDISEKTLQETIELASVDAKRLSSYVLDISDEEAVLALPKQVATYHGKLDGVFNNAGIIQPMIKFEQLDNAFIKKIFDINTFGVFNLTKASLPYVKESDQGYIINTASMGGFLPVPGQSIYGATKSAIKLWSEALYAELKDTNVQVSIVFPGAIKTNISTNSGLEMPENAENSKIKTMEADAAARAIIKGVKKGKLRIMVGKDAKLMDKFVRIAPVKAINLIQKMMKDILK